MSTLSPRHLLAALTIAITAIVLGGVPGSSMLRPIVLERTAPPLPDDTRDRDAELEVVLRTESGQPVAAARVQAFAMIPDEGGARAYVAGMSPTSADGIARLTALPRGETWVIAEAAGF